MFLRVRVVVIYENYPSDSNLSWAFPNITLLIFKDAIKTTDHKYRARGLMDKASDLGSKDSRFESWWGRLLIFIFDGKEQFPLPAEEK